MIDLVSQRGRAPDVIAKMIALVFFCGACGSSASKDGHEKGADAGGSSGTGTGTGGSPGATVETGGSSGAGTGDSGGGAGEGQVSTGGSSGASGAPTELFDAGRNTDGAAEDESSRGDAASDSSNASVGTQDAGADGANLDAGPAPNACGPLCEAFDCNGGGAVCASDVLTVLAATGIPICIPAGSNNGLSWCSGSKCDNGSTGCQLLAEIGDASWTISPPGDANAGTFAIEADVTSIAGTISATYYALSCTFSVQIPETDPVPIHVEGELRASGDGGAFLEIAPTTATVDTSSADVMGSSSTCSTAWSLASTVVNVQQQVSNATLSALQATASAFACLACNSDCEGEVACVLR